MLQPTRTKYRKAHKGRIHGIARRGEIMNYGAYGLKAMQPDRIISKQIEAARVARDNGADAVGLYRSHAVEQLNLWNAVDEMRKI